MVTLVTKVTVVMINMLTMISITITITEKKTIMTTRSHSSDFQDTYNNQINFKMEVVSATKRNIKTNMLSCNFIYRLPLDGALSTHINGDHERVSRYNSSEQKARLS